MVSVGVSTNHVGERRNFCFAEIRRPDISRTSPFVFFSQQPRITTQRICRGRRPRRPDPSTAFVPLHGL